MTIAVGDQFFNALKEEKAMEIEFRRKLWKLSYSIRLIMKSHIMISTAHNKHRRKYILFPLEWRIQFPISDIIQQPITSLSSTKVQAITKNTQNLNLTTSSGKANWSLC